MACYVALNKKTKPKIKTKQNKKEKERREPRIAERRKDEVHHHAILD